MNFKELAENIGLEQHEYLELIELFIETAMSDLGKLHSAIEEGNAEKAANASHSIKGAASSLGLMEVYEVAKKIENQARNDRLDGAAQSAHALKEKLEIIAERARV